ncbi:hypothetical protein L7F22_057769 [Adiantum nelumboides]|nr:hypothetical protein [Adiantum nelumboides]
MPFGRAEGPPRKLGTIICTPGLETMTSNSHQTYQANDSQQGAGQEDPSNLQWRVATPPQQRFYVPGYEPSAPPLEYEEHLHEAGHYTPSRLPPGTRLIDILGAAFGRVWRTSHTILRLELRRALDLDGPIVRGHDSESRRALYKRNRPRRTGSYPEDWVDGGPSSSWFQGIHGGGARLKLMQVSGHRSSLVHDEEIGSF